MAVKDFICISLIEDGKEANKILQFLDVKYHHSVNEIHKSQKNTTRLSKQNFKVKRDIRQILGEHVYRERNI
jgi:hypothetical protein